MGTGQLAPSLKEDPRVINKEGVNAKYPFTLPEKMDFLVADLSFISLRKTLPQMMALLAPKASALVLFKPQFETQGLFPLKKGIVNPKHHHELLEDFSHFCAQEGLSIQKICQSPCPGKKGNREYFFHLSPLS